VSGRRYLTVPEALYIHSDLIDDYGGSHGVRDMGALESALYRPQSGYYEDLAQEACALLESLAMNHPFVDGNKRVAFGAMDVFLMLNDHEVVGDPMMIYRHFIKLFEAGNFRLAELELYLRPKIRPIKGRT
jgi:death-on-curing protein